MECSLVSTKILAEAAKTKLPVDGSFELTGDCVFSCKMCYVHNCSKRSLEQKTFGAEKWLPVIDECAQSGLVFALLTGGEPLLHRDFDKIYSHIKDLGIVTTINTNGYLINEEKIKLFKHKPPQRFNITLYAASDTVYKELCGVNDGFTVVDRNISALKENNFNLRLNFTISKRNHREIYNLAKYADENKLTVRPTTYLFGTAENCIEERLSPQQAAETAVELFRITHSEEEMKKMSATMLMKLRAGERSAPFPDEYPGIVCQAGHTSYWIHSDGKLGYCGMIPDDNQPDVFETGFKNAWELTKKEAAAVKSSLVCNSCSYRFACRKCHAMLACENCSSNDVEQSYACKYYKALTDEFIRVGSVYEKIRSK